MNPKNFVPPISLLADQIARLVEIPPVINGIEAAEIQDRAEQNYAAIATYLRAEMLDEAARTLSIMSEGAIRLSRGQTFYLHGSHMRVLHHIHPAHWKSLAFAPGDFDRAVDVFNKLCVQYGVTYPSNSDDVASLIDQYAQTWEDLIGYDEGRPGVETGTPAIASLSYSDAVSDIALFREALVARGDATDALFGRERGDMLSRLLGNLDQTMFGEPLYRSAEEKAANLLYLIVKDHPFSDGNKRIASFLFLRYLQKQNLADRWPMPAALAATTVLLALSSPEDKDAMIRLVVSGLTPSKGTAPDMDANALLAPH